MDQRRPELRWRHDRHDGGYPAQHRGYRPRTASAAVFLWMWPFRPAAGHLLILGLCGLILAEICLHGSQKIPFACSYLPGRSNLHLSFWLCIGLVMQVVNKIAGFEQRALEDPAACATLVAVLLALVGVARWRNAPERNLHFEESPSGELQVLGLS